MAVTTTFSRSDAGHEDFRINTFVMEDQLTPDVLGLSNGGFAVAYGNYSSNGFILLDFYDSSYYAIGIYKIPYASTPTSQPTQASLTQLTNGNVLAIWDENVSGNSGIRGRLYTTSGDAIGAELTLGTSGNTAYALPQVAALRDGGFAISYNSNSAAADIYRIQYSNAGAALYGPSTVNTVATSGEQKDSAIAALADGGYVITYTDAANASSLNLRGVIYNADGSVRVSDFGIDTGPGSQSQSSVVALPNGNFAVTYTDTGYPGSEGGTSGITLSLWTPQGGRLFPTSTGFIHVNVPSTTLNEVDPDVTVLSNGYIVVSWTAPIDNTRSNIRGRIFDQDGNPLTIDGVSTDFAIVASTADNVSSAVSRLLSGSFVTAWQDSTPDGTGNGKSIHANVSELKRYISGDSTDDIVVGDQLADYFISRGGDDRLILRPGGGDDIWEGFITGTGSPDKVVLAAYPDFHSLADVLSRTVSAGYATSIFLGGGDTLTFFDIDQSDLKRDDFILEFFGTLKVGLSNALNPSNGWSSQESFPRLLGDVNGGGGADIVGFGNAGVYVALATGNGNFANPVVTLNAFNPGNGWTSQEQFPRLLGDVSGDGKADIVAFGNGGVYVALATSGGNFASPVVTLNAFNPGNGWTSQEQFPRLLGDVNGDGKADIVAFGNGGVYVSLATGGGNFAPFSITLNAFNPGNGWTSLEQFPRLLGDVNGDGNADIVGFGNGGVYVSLATGGGNFAAPFIAVEALNPGNGWTSQNQFPRRLADIDGDGMADIVGFGNGGVYVANATGYGKFATPIVDIAAFNPGNGWTNDNSFHREIADINNDGTADIVGFGNPGVLDTLGLVNAYHLI